MSNKRRSFSPEFKLQCVLNALSGQRGPAQVCREHNISEPLLTRWRRQFAEEAPKIFARKPDGVSVEVQRIAELEQQLRELARSRGVHHLDNLAWSEA